MFRKIFYALSVVMFLMVVALMSFIGYWFFFPYDVISFNSPYTTVKSAYKPGEILTLNVDVTQKTNGVEVTIYRSLQNGFVFNFTQTPTYYTEKGRQQYVNTTTTIPKETPPGTYRFKTISVFHVNPIRSIIITRVTNEFEIK